jgi:hypothetical protein
MAFSLPVVCQQIVESFEERTWVDSQSGERFAPPCPIPWGKGMER